MLKKTFFSFSRPSFNYKSLNTPREVEISHPKTVTLYCREALLKKSSKEVNVGDEVKTGQKIQLSDQTNAYIISSVTGVIRSILPVTSNYGVTYTAISISTYKDDSFDKTFKGISSQPTLKVMNNFLINSPGKPPVWRFLDTESKIETILLYGGDNDLFLQDNLDIMTEDHDSINAGIDFIREATGIEDIKIVLPEDSIQSYSGKLNAAFEIVPKNYPFAQPLMILYTVGGEVPRPKGINTSSNICLFKLEAIASIGRAFRNGVLPIEKDVSIIDKHANRHKVCVRIGTHLSHILEELNIDINDEDKIIFGGPMTGSAIDSIEHPILPNTDLVLIQDKNSISHYSNYPCINCGECIRVCPVNVPVNLLVRFLEANRYEEGADLYDLYSCIECGLCSYVCVSRIPVFQYIKLAKYELSRTGYAEGMDE